MDAARDKENEENERVALNDSGPRQVQYIVCYELSWSFDGVLYVLLPEFPNAA